MTRIQRFCSLSTKHFVWLTVPIMVIGWALDAVTGPLWSHFGIHANALEYIGGGLFWVGYCLLWVLLPVAAFRPESRFYLKGDCGLRAKRVGLVVAILLIIHVLLVIALAPLLPGGPGG